MAEPRLTLFQAEWCPFSSAVREVLTELGIDFVASHVEPWPSDRARLRALARTDRIPVLQTEDGSFYRGTREIFAYLRTRRPGRFAAAHRSRFADHYDARMSNKSDQLVESFRRTSELAACADAQVADVATAAEKAG
jgi:glutathione S-transferase